MSVDVGTLVINRSTKLLRRHANLGKKIQNIIPSPLRIRTPYTISSLIEIARKHTLIELVLSTVSRLAKISFSEKEILNVIPTYKVSLKKFFDVFM